MPKIKINYFLKSKYQVFVDPLKKMMRKYIKSYLPSTGAQESSDGGWPLETNATSSTKKPIMARLVLMLILVFF